MYTYFLRLWTTLVFNLHINAIIYIHYILHIFFVNNSTITMSTIRGTKLISSNIIFYFIVQWTRYWRKSLPWGYAFLGGVSRLLVLALDFFPPTWEGSLPNMSDLPFDTITEQMVVWYEKCHDILSYTTEKRQKEPKQRGVNFTLFNYPWCNDVEMHK